MTTLWNAERLFETVATPDAAIEFCKERELIADAPDCQYCLHPLTWSVKTGHADGYSWRCTHRGCLKRSRNCSIRHGSWFSDSKVSLKKIIELTYYWAARATTSVAIKETSVYEGESTSYKTVVDWFTFCREVCLRVVEEKCSKGIGGPGMTVEIDENKLGRRKYSRGRLVQGEWVLGGICRETKETFLIEVPKRDSETLISLLKEYVAPGSTVVSDCWKADDCLGQENVAHLKVSHSLKFVDPTTGAQTKNIACQWGQIKRSLPSTHANSSTDGFGFRLAEYMWRQQNVSVDHFEQILSDILLLYKPPTLF
ncbi:uncharacterized protein LOC117305688 [Asterias rubens]|uniref:uncharacterized protein LOC117305688 n=1 Tax=Asterias rubens TaxID=7604 RepID=UPI00145517B1|nr:uncharacterized protein LOC117305688 [Asterias rubens]